MRAKLALALLALLIGFVFNSAVLAQDDVPELSETYEYEEGGFEFDYPEDWTVTIDELDGTEFLFLSNFDDFEFAIPGRNEAFAIVSVNWFTEVTGDDLPRDEEDTPIEAMEYLNRNSDNNFGDVEGFEFDGRFGARTDAFYDGYDNTALILMIDEDAYAYMNTIGYEGDLEDLLPTFVAVLGSVRLLDDDQRTNNPNGEALELSESFRGDTLRLDYPEDWLVEEGDDGSVTVMTDDEEMMFFMMISITESSGRSDTAVEILEDLVGDIEGIDPDDIEEYEIDGREAAWVGPGDQGEEVYLFNIAVDLGDDQFALVLLVAPQDGYEDLEPTLEAIIASIEAR
jgi:hypothetical protein